jgi:hypothetical protein
MALPKFRTGFFPQWLSHMLILPGNALTAHPDVGFTNLIDLSQSNKVDNQG